jgi:DNA polymerase III delta prime subunit
MLALLTESYRPRKVSDFIGLEKPKAKMTALIAKPRASAWLFVGGSGLGKTTLAMATCNELEAELHHIPSQKCTVEAVETIRRKCKYLPMLGKRFHFVLIDEADSMSGAAQDALLSLMDSTDRPTDTIFIFTCNDDSTLKVPFKSRCFRVEFSSYGVAKDAALLLEKVWGNEAPPSASAPNFQRIVKESNNNIRAALMELEQEIMLA